MSKSLTLLIKNVRELMYLQNLSQHDVARRASISQPQLARYLTAKSTPGLDILERLADAFGVPISELLTSTDFQVLTERHEPTPDEALEILARAIRKPVASETPHSPQANNIIQELGEVLPALDESQRRALLFNLKHTVDSFRRQIGASNTQKKRGKSSS